MKSLFLLLSFLLSFFISDLVFAQLSTPTTEDIYGGRINGISVISLNDTTSRIYISTESANSVFYAEVLTKSGSESFGSFSIMPGLGSDDGYGGNIQKLFGHKNSSYLFFINNGNLYRTNHLSTTVDLIDGPGIWEFLIYEDYIFYIKNNYFYFASIDGSGSLVSTKFVPITTIYKPSIKINFSNNKIYICELKDTIKIYKSTEDYNLLTDSSLFNELTVGSIPSSFSEWDAFGIGPDGTLFLGGDNEYQKFVYYSIDDASTWSGGAISLNGVGGPNFDFAGSDSNYTIFFANGYSTFNSGSGFGGWNQFGYLGLETHPNDGSVFVDPNNSSIVYLTTDQGIGASKNGGSIIFEIDDGVEAIQVNDFSMNSTKNAAWLASKAGVRKVTNYSTTPVWTNAIFPNGDGSPYHSAEMENDNDSIAYVGNLRVYKTTNSGLSWNQLLGEGVTGYPTINTTIEAIEVCPRNKNLVLAGFSIGNSTDQGGLWYSTDAGTSWTQLQLRSSSSLPYDVDVNDIIFSYESGHNVAYVGVSYDLNISDPSKRGYSIYRAEWNDSTSTWSVRQDMQPPYTSTGSPIVVTIMDIEIDTANSIIYACGTDASVNHPVVYYKDLAGSNLWTPFSVSGFPASNALGKAITVGDGFIYCAVDNVIYVYSSTDSSWSIGYSYPVGTQINVLYYDDLLVGTGTGLYKHTNTLGVNDNHQNASVNKFKLEQNYPNPFNPTTRIRYFVNEQARVTIKLFDVLGCEIITLVDDYKMPGEYILEINGNKLGLNSGIYFYQLRTSNFTAVKKLVFLK